MISKSKHLLLHIAPTLQQRRTFNRGNQNDFTHSSSTYSLVKVYLRSFLREDQGLTDLVVYLLHGDLSGIVTLSLANFVFPLL